MNVYQSARSAVGVPDFGSRLAYGPPRETARRIRLAGAAAARDRRLALLAFGMGCGFFIFSTAVFLSSLSSRASNSTGALAQESTAPTGVPGLVVASVQRPLEMQVAANGLVFLRDARVLSIAGSTLTVGLAWGGENFVWLVRTDVPTARYDGQGLGAQLFSRDGTRIALADMPAGAWVLVTGMLDTGARQPTIDASVVRISQQ